MHEERILEDKDIPFAVHFETIKAMSRHSVPILLASSVEFLGTGVYIRNGTRYFLATANHVIHGIDPSQVVVPTSIGTFSSIQPRSCISTKEETGDIALYELIGPLALFSSIDYEHVRNLTVDGRLIYIMGFPATRVSRKNRGQIDFEQRFVLTRPVKDGHHHFHHFNERANFVCDFKKERVLNGKGDLVTFPDPYGMSGGGVFEPFYSQANTLLGYTLVGIMTEWNVEKKRYIRCTYASALRFMIDQLCVA